MTKKIKIEIAFGIIFIVALIIGISFYALSRQDLTSTDKTIKGGLPASSKNQEKNMRILFATNGQKKIYKIKKGDKWVVEIDGQESEEYDSVDNPVFSPDGTQFVYSATSSGRAFIVVNNEAWERYYNRILQIIFSPDGNTLGYVAERDGHSLVVLNGKESNEYSSISSFNTSSGSTYIIFSADGQNIAYKVTDEQGSYMVINGEAGQTYDDIISFSFNPDGTFTYDAQEDGQIITVVNNQEVANSNSNNSGTNSTSDTSSTTNQSSSTSSNSSKINSKKQPDVYLDQERLFYPTCVSGSSGKICNF